MSVSTQIHAPPCATAVELFLGQLTGEGRLRPLILGQLDSIGNLGTIRVARGKPPKLSDQVRFLAGPPLEVGPPLCRQSPPPVEEGWEALCPERHGQRQRKGRPVPLQRQARLSVSLNGPSGMQAREGAHLTPLRPMWSRHWLETPDILVRFQLAAPSKSRQNPEEGRTKGTASVSGP